MSKISWLLTLCVMGISLVASAQQIELGGLVGTSFYFGDLNPWFSPKRPGAAASFFMRRNYDGRLALRGGLTYANIGASDSRSSQAVARARNLSFQSNIFEGQLVAEFNFISYHSANPYHREDEPFSPYLSAGICGFYHNPKALYNGQWYALRDYGTEGQAPGNEYNRVQFGLVVGGGFKWDLSRNWSLNIDIQSRILYTDYLDDVSGTYADKRLIEGYRGSLGAALSDRSLERQGQDAAIGLPGYQRGDSRSNDSYLTLQIGLAYRFLKLSCPAY